MSKPDYKQKISTLKGSITQKAKALEVAKTPEEKATIDGEIKELEKQLSEVEKAATNSDDSKSTSKAKKAKEELKMMDKYKTDELYINSKGAYFTNQNMAELSEKDKKKVKKITREIVESQIK